MYTFVYLLLIVFGPISSYPERKITHIKCYCMYDVFFTNTCPLFRPLIYNMTLGQVPLIRENHYF